MWVVLFPLCFCLDAPVFEQLSNGSLILPVYDGEIFTINCKVNESCPESMITLSVDGGDPMYITDNPIRTFTLSSSGTYMYLCSANNSRAVTTFLYQVQVMPRSSKLITLHCCYRFNNDMSYTSTNWYYTSTYYQCGNKYTMYNYMYIIIMYLYGCIVSWWVFSSYAA